MRQIIAVSVLLITLLLLVSAPNILADVFMVLFNFVYKLVLGMQSFAIEVFEGITQ